MSGVQIIKLDESNELYDLYVLKIDKTMEKVDQVINKISDDILDINRMSDDVRNNKYLYGETMLNVLKALAELVSARKND